MRARTTAGVFWKRLSRSAVQVIAFAAASSLMSGQTSEKPDVHRAQQILDVAGITLGFSYTVESISTTHESQKVPLTGALSDLEIRWQPKMRGPFGKAEFTAIYSVYAQTRTSEMPDLQGISSLTARSFRRWREAYVEMPLLDRIRIKAGKVDANTEFAVVESGADFSNASVGVSPTLFTMPSYPDGAPSVNLFFDAGHGISISGGVYYPSGGGAYYVSEMAGRWSSRLPGRIAAGLWRQRSGGLLDPVPSSTGTFLVLEQTLLRRAASPGLQAFARISTADGAVAPASFHDVYGVSWTGFGRRQNDSAGFALLDLRPTTDGVSVGAEKAYEVYYKLPLTRFLEMKLDVQRVRRPAGLHETAPFTAAAVRLLFNISSSREGQAN